MREKREVHKPNAAREATKNIRYADRTGYLEEMCKGINAYRGEGKIE